MTTIAIITAMQSEYDAITSLYNFSDKGGIARTQVYGKNIMLIKSGIGKVNAAIATQKACQEGADIVITTGLAGGIDDILKQGDIVLADNVCYHDVWCGEPNVKGQIQDLPAQYTTKSEILKDILEQSEDGYFNTGQTVTGDQFLTDVNRLKEIKKDFPQALAVDMESASVAQVCYLNNTDFISLRIISDVVGKENQVDEYNSFWENVPHKASQMVDIVIKSISAKAN